MSPQGPTGWSARRSCVPVSGLASICCVRPPWRSPGRLHPRGIRAGRCSDGVEMHREPLVAVADQGAHGPKFTGRLGEADVGEAVEEALEHEGDLEAGEGCAEAEVDAVAEGEVVLDRAGRVERV